MSPSVQHSSTSHSLIMFAEKRQNLSKKTYRGNNVTDLCSENGFSFEHVENKNTFVTMM